MSKVSLLPNNWKVPQVFRDRLGNKVGRQRAMLAEGHLLLVLHAPPAPDERHRQGRFFWRSPDATWKSNSLGDGIKSLDRHLEQYLQTLQKLEDAEYISVTKEFVRRKPRTTLRIAPAGRAAFLRHLEQLKAIAGDQGSSG